MKHIIKIEMDSAEDMKLALDLIRRCQVVREGGNTSTPIQGGTASILLCALARSKKVSGSQTGTMKELGI